MDIILDFLRQFNWIDILVLVIFVRLIFIALKEGFATEFFKILGTVFALYLSLHYYSSLAASIGRLVSRKNPPVVFLEFFSYILLCLIGYNLFVLLRIFLAKLISAEINPKLNKWGGFSLSVGRAFLLVSLVLYLMLIPGFQYFSRSVGGSFSGKRIVLVGPNTYSWIWYRIMSKFISFEKSNGRVSDTVKF